MVYILYGTWLGRTRNDVVLSCLHKQPSMLTSPLHSLLTLLVNPVVYFQASQKLSFLSCIEVHSSVSLSMWPLITEIATLLTVAFHVRYLYMYFTSQCSGFSAFSSYTHTCLDIMTAWARLTTGLKLSFQRSTRDACTLRPHGRCVTQAVDR